MNNVMLRFTDAPIALKGLQRVMKHLLIVPAERPIALAPVRSKPLRTYDPKTDAPRPEGNHVPMLLAHALEGEQEKWKVIREGLRRYGRECGLFNDINVRRLGRSASDPFQLMVKASGSAANLTDVGYGVSQVLPILVDPIIAKAGQMFLMQQPEVHLHPRAQAGLGTFFGYLAKAEKKRFVIETHSDYLIDRVCLDIRDKKNGLTPDDVVILYFQRDKSGVTIHPLTIDEAGNICGAPEGYRDFFLKEQGRLLGV